MKAVIKKVTFEKEWLSEKYNKTYFIFNVSYDEKTAQYVSTDKEQKNFIEGKEVEFTEESKDYNGLITYRIKPIKPAYQGNYSKAVKKEQSRYSGFAVSYVKDLIIADKIKIEQWEAASKKIFDFMVALDKSLEV